MHFIKLIQPIIKQAGALALSHFKKSIEISFKQDKSIVTHVDLLIQNFLVESLTKVLPGSGFRAEEGQISNIQEFTWVIDPIDGTRNFVRGLPYFCINVALVQGAEVVVAITYQPVTDELFWAERGSGAFWNGQRLSMKQKYKETGALVVVSDAKFRNHSFLQQVKTQLKDLEQGVRFRVNGAVALDLAYTSAGIFDIVIFQNLACWDVVAGMLLIKESGGFVSPQGGLNLQGQISNLVAGEPELCEMIINLINLQK